MPTQKNIHPIFESIIDRQTRESVLNQKSKVIWFTGLSGSGKSTVAIALERYLFEKGYFCQVLDGDNIRSGINNNLGFSIEDRTENIRRIAEISRLYLNSGIIVLASFISPTNEIRQYAKGIIGESDFVLVHVDAPLEVCENRDVKGLYKKARKGEIKGFTGIDSPFERPDKADYVINTAQEALMESIENLSNFLIPIISTK